MNSQQTLTLELLLNWSKHTGGHSNTWTEAALTSAMMSQLGPNEQESTNEEERFQEGWGLGEFDTLPARSVYFIIYVSQYTIFSSLSLCHNIQYSLHYLCITIHRLDYFTILWHNSLWLSIPCVVQGLTLLLIAITVAGKPMVTYSGTTQSATGPHTQKLHVDPN